MLGRVLRQPAFAIGAGLLLVFFVVVLLSPLIIPDPETANSTNIRARLVPPGERFLFGSDALGRDVFARVVLGTALALKVAFSIVALAMVIGVPLGLYAGLRSNIASSFIMRSTDLFLSVPQLILALALAQILRPSVETAIIALAATYWPFFTRIVYTETRKIAANAFIEALQSMGASTPRILFLHILPNALPVIIVRASIGMGYAVLSTAVLGFLGVGAPPPTPEWGVMVAESRDHLPDGWWMAVYPGLAIMFLVLAFNLIGDGLRDLVDPHRTES